MLVLPYGWCWPGTRPWTAPSSGWGTGCVQPQLCSSALINQSIKQSINNSIIQLISRILTLKSIKSDKR